ncbi:MAG: hypothetical protein J3Q66DRAFT_40943 [Benniella sp.]|nr:MAG: hypothetical protein J3Q66DRAFT_40943 [Benniella sp.]
MDKHIISWKQMKGRSVTLTAPMEPNKGDMKDFMSSLESCSSSRPVTRSHGSKRKDMTNDEVIEENCTICLQEYILSDQLRPLPCKHSFHVECIDTWLKGNVQCPICRHEVTSESIESI